MWQNESRTLDLSHRSQALQPTLQLFPISTRELQYTVKKISTLNHTYKCGNESPHLLVWVLTKKGTVHFGTH
jgi:hypothetical protein